MIKMFITAMILCYLIGSIPNGLIFGRLLWNVDLRKHGSGNIGATNAWRVIGKSAGILIFVLDFLKGALAVKLAEIMVQTPEAMAWGGFLAMFGHTSSIFLLLEGGKGVATGLGAAMMLMPKAAIGAVLVWAVIVKLTKYVSAGSLIAALSMIVFVYIFDYPKACASFCGLALGCILVRHWSNIKRLLKGTENKVSW